MATSMANPQASAPQPGGGAGAPPQANELQTTLSKIVQLLHQIATSNTSVQDPLNKAVQNIVQAIKDSSQAQTQQPPQPQSPPQG